MNKDLEKYMQAFNRQQWDKSDNRVVLIERLPECYRLTTAHGVVAHIDNNWGIAKYPVVICGR